MLMISRVSTARRGPASSSLISRSRAEVRLSRSEVREMGEVLLAGGEMRLETLAVASVGGLVDGLGCLAEQDLGGGVGDDGFAEVAAQQVEHVLSGQGQAAPVFAGGFGHLVEEFCAGLLPHQQPCFVDDDHAGSADGGV